MKFIIYLVSTAVRVNRVSASSEFADEVHNISGIHSCAGEQSVSELRVGSTVRAYISLDYGVGLDGERCCVTRTCGSAVTRVCTVSGIVYISSSTILGGC